MLLNINCRARAAGGQIVRRQDIVDRGLNGCSGGESVSARSTTWHYCDAGSLASSPGNGLIGVVGSGRPEYANQQHQQDWQHERHLDDFSAILSCTSPFSEETAKLQLCPHTGTPRLSKSYSLPC